MTKARIDSENPPTTQEAMGEYESLLSRCHNALTAYGRGLPMNSRELRQVFQLKRDISSALLRYAAQDETEPGDPPFQGDCWL